MAASSQHVLIIGAGVTGLLIAQGLKKHSISFTVFEKEPSATYVRPREWGMSLQWGLPLLADALPEDLFEKISSVACDPSYQPEDPGRLPTFNSESGELLKDVPLVFMYRVSRRKLRALCAEGINIQYDKRVRSVEYRDNSSVTVFFDDGSEATGTAVIGADGAQSAIRAHLFGEERSQPTELPFRAANLHVRYNDAEKALFVRRPHPIQYMAVNPKGYWTWTSIQDVPTPDDPSTWTHQLMMSWNKEINEEPISLIGLKKRAKLLSEPFRSAFDWIPEGTPVYETKLAYWIPVPWDSRNGRVTLAGDAAHPMSFQRGQGLNHGIADASDLVKCFAATQRRELSLTEAFDQYQTGMISRAGSEVQLSKTNSEFLHDWSKVLASPILSKKAAYAIHRSEES